MFRREKRSFEIPVFRPFLTKKTCTAEIFFSQILIFCCDLGEIPKNKFLHKDAYAENQCTCIESSVHAQNPVYMHSSQCTCIKAGVHAYKSVYMHRNQYTCTETSVHA